MTMQQKYAPTPWHRTECGDGRQALRNLGGIICKFTAPHHYEGQDDRYAQEMAVMEATIALVEAAPDLLEALDVLLERRLSVAKELGVDPMAALGSDGRYAKAIAAITKARPTTNETTTP